MKNRSTKMTKQVFEKHIKENLPKYMKHYNQIFYSLDLFGGEPTLNWEIINHAVKLCQQDVKCRRIRLISNGLNITNEQVDYIIQNNIKFSLSFDGLWTEESVQETQKEKILKLYLSKLECYEKLGTTPSVCVTPENLNMKENLRFFFEKFKICPEFKIVRDNIWKDEDVKIFRKEMKKVLSYSIELIESEHMFFPFKYYLKRMISSVFLKTSKKRCFVGRSGASFGPDGKIYPCARFLTDRRMELSETNIKEIDHFSRTFDEECERCILSNFCDHLCTEQELEYGLMRNVCQVYKIIYEELNSLNNKLANNKIWLDEMRKIIREVAEWIN
jgi:radical SAM protein with 4Fe4S-binding SPASM domain